MDQLNKGLSGVRRKVLAPFLGEGAAVMWSPYPSVPGMNRNLRVKVPRSSWWRRRASEIQGHYCEVMPEGST